MGVDIDANPLRVGLPRGRPTQPCVMVIFGGTGDLALRKLVPAVYGLHLSGLLPRVFALVCYASPEWSVEKYRDTVHSALALYHPGLPLFAENWDAFAGLIHYVRRTDDRVASLHNLASEIERIRGYLGCEDNYLYYLSVPPTAALEQVRSMRVAGLHRAQSGYRRIVIEKPFGFDLSSARALNAELLTAFSESQIYRIDHYLGKETVQNILVFRFANSFFEPLMSSAFVDNIQVTVAETVGVEKRGRSYESTGALRDIIQNHALQIVSLVCMKRPASLHADDVRSAKSALLSAIPPVDAPDCAIRGQYGHGVVAGRPVPGYREEENVDPESATETYAALKLEIANDRWRGVPVFVRTGKRLARTVTQVAITLKQDGASLFADLPGIHTAPNHIALNIQPDEGISAGFSAKTPGVELKLRPVRMEFRYSRSFESDVPEAYQRLILDALFGDQSLFPRADEIEAMWSICDPTLQTWRQSEEQPHQYAPGTWGPEAADEFIARHGRRWRRL